MRTFLLLLLLLPAALAAQVASTPAILTPQKAAGISRGAFAILERRFDGVLAGIGGINDPVEMLGGTRGTYLEGYGAVFTAELSLIITPTINPFRQTITKEMAAQVHQRKLDRLPALRAAMREILRSAAAALPIPDKQLVVIVVRLDYLSWEDTTGLPGHILMRADRAGAIAGEIKEEVQ